MLMEYIEAGMRRARYEILEDRTYFGRIEGVQGVWANEDSLEACREELQSTFEDWILFSLHIGAELPVLDGLDLNPAEGVKEAAC